MRLRAPRSLKTHEQKTLWQETCLGLQDLGLLARTSPATIKAHIKNMVALRDLVRKPRHASPREELRAIKAVRRSAARLFAPDSVRLRLGLAHEVQKRLEAIRDRLKG